MSSEQPNRCEVAATGLDDSGAGVGAAGSISVHVPDLLPGERAEVVIDHRSPHRPQAWGRILKRIGPPSAARVEPMCPGFGRCGGCVWQHLAYSAQLDEKRARVAGPLARVGVVASGGVEIGGVRPAPALTGYR
ncbi:MAG TPA: hypothetical protein VLT58_09285, partial [Polyangia bacterium]|nr:hypothetical protein [Polyangia bacterium]